MFLSVVDLKLPLSSSPELEVSEPGQESDGEPTHHEDHLHQGQDTHSQVRGHEWEPEGQRYDGQQQNIEH